MESLNSHYDFDSTIFSPEGRLFQVEYARETIKKGSTTLGLKFKEGVLLVTYKDISSNLIEITSTDKIAQIDNNIICSYVGLSADAMHLLSYSQEIATTHKIWYNEQITIKDLVEEVCTYKHLFTTFNGLRPFGLVFIVAGFDSKGVHLYGTDPSGAFLEYKAICEGKKSDKISKYFNRYYTPELNRDEAIELTIKAIQKSFDKKIKKDNLEIATIEKNISYCKICKEDLKI